MCCNTVPTARGDSNVSKAQSTGWMQTARRKTGSLHVVTLIQSILSSAGESVHPVRRGNPSVQFAKLAPNCDRLSAISYRRLASEHVELVAHSLTRSVPLYLYLYRYRSLYRSANPVSDYLPPNCSYNTTTHVRSVRSDKEIPFVPLP